MRWTAADVAAAVGGRLVSPATGLMPEAASVTIDSRGLAPGALFIPIRAGRDGHDFIRHAIAAGAAGYLVAHGRVAVAVVQPPRAGRPNPFVIEVGDTAVALLDLGRAARRRLAGPVVGITGSVGKTSTKDLAAAALGARWRVAASPRSLNNELGVPLTLANAPDGSEVTVVEMGARGPGHIALLCRVAEPTVAVVTAVAHAHTAVFGDLSGVAAAKAELVEALPPGGTAILNGDDPLVSAMARRTAAATIRYSAAGDRSAEVAAGCVELDEELRPSFVLRSPWGSSAVRLAARGRHQVGNALAALATALDAGVALDAACDALGSAEPSPWRMELQRSAGGAVVINDAYNANPASMTAALRALAELPQHRKLAVLGEMAELGPGSPALHARMAALAAELGIRVIPVGTPLYGIEQVRDIDEALEALGSLGPDDAVLVKASRVVGLERLAARLVDRYPS